MYETILIILLAIGIGNNIEKQKPKDKLLEMSDGSIIETVVDNDNYYCPQYCSTKHKHFSHYNNTECDMKNKCYHFVHYDIVNIASVINESEKDITSAKIIINNKPEVINVNLDKERE